MRHLACVAVVLVLAVPRTAAPDVLTSALQSAITPDAALERFRKGNARFVAEGSTARDWPALVKGAAAGQYPFAAVLGCMDSRVPVEIVFDQALGDLFTVRVAGNVVNDDEVGSLEYASKSGVKLIVVLGHTRCGAVKGALDDVQFENLTGLLAKIRPAVTAAGCTDSHDDACVTKVAEENVRRSMHEIRARSRELTQRIDRGTLRLVGAMYDVATGAVTFLGP